MEETRPQIENPLGSAPITPLMLKFTLPSIVSMVVGSVYNLVDQFFIGQAVGVLGNSATNVAYPLTICCVALGLVFGIGSAAAFNLCMGRREYDRAPRYIGNGFTALLLSGVVLMLVTLAFLTPILRLFGSPEEVLPYARVYAGVCAFGFPFMILTTGGGHLMRADGSPKMVMVCSLSGAAINIVLDALFVMGLGMGMFGAALATILGQIFSGLLVIRYVLFHFKTLPLKRSYFLPRPKVLLRILSLGISPGFNQSATLVMQVVLNNALRYYGGLSVYGDAIPLAVAGISTKVSNLCFSVVIGIGQGCQPIFSFNYGAKNYRRVKQTFWRALAASSVVSVVCFLVFQLFPRQLLGLFGNGSEAYFQCGVLFFRVFLMMTLINFIHPIVATLFTSIGKPGRGIFLSLTRQVLFLIPMILIFPLFWGFQGIVYAAPVSDFLAMLACLVLGGMELRSMTRLEAADSEG